MVGSLLPWYDPIPAGEFLSPAAAVNVDLYQIPQSDGSRWTIVIGAVVLFVIGVVAVSFSSRRLSIHRGGICVALASIAVALGVLAVKPPMVWEGVLSLPPPKGPGVTVTLIGAGLGLLAVVTQLIWWVHSKW